MVGSEYLSGWKDIANYLGKSVRTVQRYERHLGLPVHRLSRGFQGSVIAAKAEVDAWVKASPLNVISAQNSHPRSTPATLRP